MQETIWRTDAEAGYDREAENAAFVADVLKDRPAVVKGSPLFKARVRRVLAEMRPSGAAGRGDPLPAKFIIASDRIVYNDNLSILYVNRNLKISEIRYILSACADGVRDFSFYSLQALQTGGLSAVCHPFHTLYRKAIRKSLEKRVTAEVLRIVGSPPKGKVATEDQHFLLTIMRLEMFIKSLCVKVEKNSAIRLLTEEQRKRRQLLLSLQKKQLAGVNTLAACVTLREDIQTLDAVIYRKRLAFQTRLIGRVFACIERENGPDRIFALRKRNRQRRLKLARQIRSLTASPAGNEAEQSPRGRRKQAVIAKKLTALKRQSLKVSYMDACFTNQAKFTSKLKTHMELYRQTELIPASFHKSAQTRVFNALRFLLSALFVGFYLYIIRLPLALAPFLFVLGLYVFQPIANKFAILLMTKHTNNSGLKRLSAPELKQEISRRAGRGQYLCAVDLPLFTGKAEELYTTEYYIKKNIRNLGNTLAYYRDLGIVYQITSNTADMKIVEKEIEITQRVQALANLLYGKKRIYFLYLHRSSSTAKKVGNILASHLLKQHGYTYPVIYTDPKKFSTTFEPKPLFDRVYGNFLESLCGSGGNQEFSVSKNQAIQQDILRGKRLQLTNKVEFSFFIDNKNELKPGSFEAALSAMMHPENRNITIIQPQMSIEDPVYEGTFITSAFLRMMRIARDVHNDRYLSTLHGLYSNMSAYYGKGMLRLAQYDYMVMNEILNLQYIDSHDWQESVFNHAALAISGDTRINAVRMPARSCDSRYGVLMEKGHESILVSLAFRQNRCTILYPDGNTRTIRIAGNVPDQEKIASALDYLDNKVDVGERELISTIGSYQRDARWLKGDLQMFHTFAAYRGFMPPYHRFHLGNIFRRFTNEIALLAWVGVNFAFSTLHPSVMAGQGTLFILTLYLAVTAFGFAGIDLFIYPLFFESKSRPILVPRSGFKTFLDAVADGFKKIVVGLWQFVIYLFIAWPRVYLGMKSSVKILLAGIDQKIDWGAASNACISAEETSKRGLPFKRFITHYSGCMMIGALLTAGLFSLIALGKAFPSVFLPFNLGMIAVSLITSPFVAYLVSKQLRHR